MNAARALIEAQDAGLVLRVDGDDLMLTATVEPPTALLQAISRFKPEIITELIKLQGGRSADDWLVIFNERAAIIEYDGGQNREVAELQALGACLLDHTTAQSSKSEFEKFVRSLVKARS